MNTGEWLVNTDDWIVPALRNSLAREKDIWIESMGGQHAAVFYGIVEAPMCKFTGTVAILEGPAASPKVLVRPETFRCWPTGEWQNQDRYLVIPAEIWDDRGIDGSCTFGIFDLKLRVFCYVLCPPWGGNKISIRDDGQEGGRWQLIVESKFEGVPGSISTLGPRDMKWFPWDQTLSAKE